MKLLDEGDVQVHRLVIFNEYYYTVAVKVTGTRVTAVIKDNAVSVSVAASAVYAVLVRRQWDRMLSVRQTKLLGSLMRGEHDSLSTE